MAAERHPQIEIVGLPTVREPDGLARSSRNRYLSDDDRKVALAISQALQAGAAAVSGGPESMLAAARDVLDQTPGLSVDYLAVVDAADWEPAGQSTREATVIVAARVGSTRLIDNVHVILDGTANTLSPKTSAPDLSGLKE
jgi:pantoate--beta-alanine ligase